MPRTLTIATRESPLALWQAKYVQDALGRAHSELEVKLLGMTSRGDQLLDVSDIAEELGEEYGGWYDVGVEASVVDGVVAGGVSSAG